MVRPGEASGTADLIASSVRVGRARSSQRSASGSISQEFERVARNAGLPVTRFQDLRHTHAALLIKEGVPVKVVSERLVNATTAFTIETYQHVLPSMQAERVSARR